MVDDKSTDESPTVVEKFQKLHPEITFIRLEKNEGICKAFNTGFKICSGDFIIDLAADDILLPERLERGVKIFETLDDSYGVIFGDAEFIDPPGKTCWVSILKKIHTIQYRRVISTNLSLSAILSVLRR